MTDIDGQTLDTLQHILEDSHVGEQNAAKSDELATALGEKDTHDTNPSIRDAVRQLVNQRHVPVASSNKGYWIVANADGIDDEIQSIRDRIGALNRRVQALKQARTNYDAPDATRETPDPDPDSDVVEQTYPCACCDTTVPTDDCLYPEDGEYQDQTICSHCYGTEVLGVST